MFHSPERQRVVVNIGGIANITCLPADATQPCGTVAQVRQRWENADGSATVVADLGGGWTVRGQVDAGDALRDGERYRFLGERLSRATALRVPLAPRSSTATTQVLAPECRSSQRKVGATMSGGKTASSGG